LAFERPLTEKDIFEYENQQKIKNLMTGAGMASILGAAAGGYRRSIPITAASVLGAAMAGYGRGKAKRKEGEAIDRIRRRYGIRPKKKVFNPEEIFPEKVAMEKTAIVGSLMHWMTTGGLGPLMADVAAIPILARGATRGTRKAIQVAAKQQVGRPLTSGEKTVAALNDISSAVKDQVDKIKPGPLHTIADLATDFLGPSATAAKVGPAIGKAIKEVEKVSPRYADLAIGAIPGGRGQLKLMAQTRRDTKKFKKALDIIRETRVGRLTERASGASGPTLLKRYLTNPNKAIADAKRLRKVEDSIIRASKAIAVAGGTGLGMHVVGSLPEEEGEFWDGFGKRAEEEEEDKKRKPHLPPHPSSGDLGQGTIMSEHVGPISS